MKTTVNISAKNEVTIANLQYLTIKNGLDKPNKDETINYCIGIIGALIEAKPELFKQLTNLDTK
jgi:hypothetical protein